MLQLRDETPALGNVIRAAVGMAFQIIEPGLHRVEFGLLDPQHSHLGCKLTRGRMVRANGITRVALVVSLKTLGCLISLRCQS